MATRHAKVGLQMLMDRRAREDALEFYTAAEREDTHFRQRADFETRTHARYQASELKRRAKQRADQAEREIDARRDKLRALLAAEEQQFTAEVGNTMETVQTRRLRLMESLKHLQEQRQKEHDDFVRMKTEQGWRDNCDPLRAKISQYFLKTIVEERDKQVAEHDLARMEGDAEEAKYAEHVRKDVADWNESLKFEREENEMKKARNREVWLAEMKRHQEQEAKRKHDEYIESLEFRTTTEQAIQRAKEEADEKARVQAARRRELDELNTQQTTYKQRIVDEEKATDVMYAQKAAEELRQEQEDAIVEKLVRMRKQARNGELLTAQLTRTAASNDEAERLLKQTQDEVNRRDDERRAADLAARRKLMLDAVADRVRTIKLHEQQREGRKAEKEIERQEMEEQMRIKRQLDQEEYEARRRLIDNQYQMLAQQTLQRQRLNEQRKKEENDSVKAMLQGWQDEERRIQETLANPENFLTRGRFRGHR